MAVASPELCVYATPQPVLRNTNTRCTFISSLKGVAGIYASIYAPPTARKHSNKDNEATPARSFENQGKLGPSGLKQRRALVQNGSNWQDRRVLGARHPSSVTALLIILATGSTGAPISTSAYEGVLSEVATAAGPASSQSIVENSDPFSDAMRSEFSQLEAMSVPPVGFGRDLTLDFPSSVLTAILSDLRTQTSEQATATPTVTGVPWYSSDLSVLQSASSEMAMETAGVEGGYRTMHSKLVVPCSGHASQPQLNLGQDILNSLSAAIVLWDLQPPTDISPSMFHRDRLSGWRYESNTYPECPRCKSMVFPMT
ncbi:hypothetical protein C8R47DRAFT_1084239 [Mycena vitilis]|nr:hypothetical protein C8R47DRAFT_1084239 [Mycena vitilis]